MDVFKIPFSQIDQLSLKDKAYYTEDPKLRPFYKYDPTLAAFEQVIADKATEDTPRALLVEVLEKQYQKFETGEKVKKNIQALAQPNTFTVTTAHQPSLCTGPLYYIYKIISTINLARQLNSRFTEYYFVPVFVSGGEDHDFEEINHLNLFNKRIEWKNEEQGAVGMMQTETLKEVLQELKDILGDSPNATTIYQKVEEAYTSHPDYGTASLHLANSLFQEDGLVVLGMNQAELKRAFMPILEKELMEQPSKEFVETAATALEVAGFSGQAHPRQINLFYLKDQMRERIIQENGHFEVLNTDFKFTKEELLGELQAHPEHFSPNVIIRPLYQEYILPNLAYIGGGGEIAYWMERKEQFKYFGINFPMLIRRNSVLWIDRGSAKRLDKLGLNLNDLFEETETLIKKFVEGQTDTELNLKEEKAQIEAIFQAIEATAKEVDPSLVKTVGAERAKQIKSLEQLEGRLVRAEKKKHETALNQIRSLKDKLFPGNGLQERHDNFMGLYLKYGGEFFEVLKKNLHPLEKGFVVILDK